MLEGLMKGLAVWLYELILEIVEFIADSLLEVFNMDLAYFESNVPVTSEIVKIIMAAGWAILIGNLTFQAMKSMMSGIGFEGEDPKILFCRTFVFSFLLLASRQICEIGLGITGKLNTLLQMPDAVRLGLPPMDIFVIPGSWLLVIIMGIVVMFQIIKFFFEIAERYVVLVMLTILSPLAFGVGGSKNTEDIFKGWARMFGSSCLMMLFNTVFLKLLLSAMSNTPSAAGMLPWMLLVVAIARVARKIDDIVARIGLNTARTGDPIGRGGIMYPIMVMRSLGGIVSKTAGAGKAASRTPSSGRQPEPGGRPGGATATPTSPPPPPPPSPASSGGASQQSQQGGGASDTPNGAPASASSSGTPQGAQPAMSPTSPGTGKGPPPSRPPVGWSRNRSRPDIYRDDERDARDAAGSERAVSGKSPLSVDSATPSGVNTQPRENGAVGGENNGQRTTPPLSVDSRTPGIPGAAGQKPVMDSAGTPSMAAVGANTPQRYRPKKPANIDIYRDDDTADGLRPMDGQRPASTYKGRPAVSSGQASHVSGGSQTVSHKDTRSTRIQQSVEESTRSTANAANQSAPGTASPQTPPSRASSPGAGRIGGRSPSGGLNQPGGQNQHGAPNRSGGTTVPGGAHRPAAAPPAPQNTGPSVAPSASDRKHPVTQTGNASQRTGKRENGASTATQSGNPSVSQGARPTRYRRVDNKPRQQPESAAGKDAGQAATRPISGNPGAGTRPHGRGPSQGGGNRP